MDQETTAPPPVISSTEPLCLRAFEILCSALRPSIPTPPPLDLPSTHAGLFVTWSVPRGRPPHYALRGCIGTLTPAPLDIAVDRYAEHAAFRDSRFDPISETELDGLKVGVSVLWGFEKVSDIYDWDVGIHGIVLELDGGKYSATYLPEVCREQGWTKAVCLRSLADKAGCRGRGLDGAVVTRYRSTKGEMPFERYLAIVTAHPDHLEEEDDD